MINFKETMIDPQGNEHKLVDYTKDYVSSRFGFWVFLIVELIVFGSIFAVFFIYFYQYTKEFIHYSGYLNIYLGSIDTVILVVSTYTISTAIYNFKKAYIRDACIMTLVTLLLAITFLIIKAFEYNSIVTHNIFLDTQVLDSFNNESSIFFDIYFAVTGLHCIHIFVGIIFISIALYRLINGSMHPKNSVFMKNIILYWNFVHIIWIFIFPIFYMIGA